MSADDLQPLVALIICLSPALVTSVTVWRCDRTRVRRQCREARQAISLERLRLVVQAPEFDAVDLIDAWDEYMQAHR
jgi:hypothetical protein